MLRLALLLLLLLPAPRSRAQDPDSTRSRILDAARTLIAETDWCTLVTIGPDGHPRARVMDPFEPEDDMTVWLATNARSRKVDEIHGDPRVTLHWSDPGGGGYVTLLAHAEIVTDPAERAARWKESWTTFYSDRNRGEDYVLIRVVPFRLEIVSYGAGLVGNPDTWQPVGIDL